LVEQGAEVLVVPAAWVAGPLKVHHWRTLAIARAVENTAYVAAVGQPGPRYTGHSLLAAPDGEVVAEAGTDAAVLDGRIDRELLERARAQNPSLANRRF
ncbi:MAG: nitrilase-related carbon-nitrogen hydrolase, partial [Actinomycetes bacterium]